MKIGYPCINRTIECQGDKTFRLKSYSENRLREVIGNNLRCLAKILDYNTANNILFFRISSELVPFASHPVCKVPWQSIFKPDFIGIGNTIKKQNIRISMHPDQFTLINSRDEDIFGRSVKELLYHAEVLDLMGLDGTAKIQIHVGGVYGDKASSIGRFIKRYQELPGPIRKRLVIEN
ncbi:MAG TPA: UV DNA damage repair endonuclease UvsE, partial [Candidatus Omnitrophota bacterium]|nr:UV DNA damage repair endonuclease UvsE [Candidatus Omnitrophota bacterium]